jgi:hypothetical protein
METEVSLPRISGPHNDPYEEFKLLRYNATKSDESQPSFGGTCRLLLQRQRVIQIRNQHKAASKMEEICSTETSVTFHLAARRYILEHKILLVFLHYNTRHWKTS